MKVLIWCGDAANQMALCGKINQQFEIVGIVLERKIVKTNFKFSTFIQKVVDRIRFALISKAWYGMLAFYKDKYKGYPEVPIIIVDNINNAKTLDFANKYKPDVIVVSGTSLVREPLLSIPLTKGMLNLHTGLSPYVKGGPNCTNWCIANNELHLIGNTIMWIDKGIDSGNIVTTEVVKFSGKETLLEVHIIVMEAAHNLYILALNCIQNQFVNCPNVNQDSITKGKLYKTIMWDSRAKRNLLNNFKKFNERIHSEMYKRELEKIKLVKLK